MADGSRRLWRWFSSHTHHVVMVGLVFSVPVLLWLCLAFLPAWWVPGTSLDERQAQNDVRTTMLQGLGGLVLGVGVYFTSRQLNTAQQAQVTAREGQITERYTRAVDQLGNGEVDVRIGGIFALERIARDSPHDQPTIGEVLTSFVRGRSPWPPSRPGQFVATAALDKVPELHSRYADVQAAITVLGRSGFAKALTLDLHQVDLRNAALGAAHLEEAILVGAHLEGATLWDSHLEEAILTAAHLEEADLGGAHLEGATLVDAHLEGAYLEGAHLEGADLTRAHLEGATLWGAHLEGAYLKGAHLEGADLMRAHLDRATWREVFTDSSTRWPEGFEPGPSGGTPRTQNLETSLGDG